MIIFDLSCEFSHRFEGWFRSSEDFQLQLNRNLIACPQCGSHTVRRIPSAVAIGSQRAAPEAVRPQEPSSLPKNIAKPAASAAPTELMAAYRQVVQTLLSQSQDVGQNFAEEARKIHYQEVEARPIHGQASIDECEALRDEGIEVLQLPILRDNDLN
jgi:hypothetical protein